MPGQIIPPTGAQLQGPILSNFVPKLNFIQSVTNAEFAVVTTVSPHGYYDGMFVRVNVPPLYGMSILQQTLIAIVSPTQFITLINTLNQNPFVAPNPYPPLAFTPAQTIPMTGIEMNIAPPGAQ